ncbi:hypothetical protein FPV67DRAFT_1451370 [Lyophyllum atratum]|nr:hypothetical protein FPV67DRAFT_1451370 [Lyophyllum atratum]
MIPPPVKCYTHGEVAWQVVRKEGRNKGRYFASCRQVDPVTENQCSFYRFHTEKGPTSPTHTPPGSSDLESLSSAPSSPNPDAVTPAATQAATQAAGHRQLCAKMGCKSGRLRKGCTTRMCRSHCIAAGGCHDPAHGGAGSTPHPSAPSATPQAPRLPPAPASASQNETSGPSPTSMASRTPAPADTLLDRTLLSTPPVAQRNVTPGPSSMPPAGVHQLAATVIDPRPHPTYSSHMAPIFTSQVETEMSLREARRREDELRIESIRRHNQTVVVYGWNENDAPPAVTEVQDGFSWPHFIISQEVLACIGLGAVPASSIQVYRDGLGVWANANTNHVILVERGSRIFLRSSLVTTCRDFAVHLHPPHTPADIRTNLPAERAYVKRKEAQRQMKNFEDRHAIRTPSLPTTSHTPFSTPLSNAAMAHTPPFEVTNYTTRPTKRARHEQKSKGKGKQRATSILEVTSGSEKELVPATAPSTRREISAPEIIEISSDSDCGGRLLLLPTVKREGSREASFMSFSSLNSRYTASPSPEFQSIKPEPGISLIRRWPADFYAVDVVKGFDALRTAPKGTTKGSVFNMLYGLKFSSSTFYEHQARWLAAPPDERDRAIAADRTVDGLWSTFMANNPAKGADIKATRKRMKRAASVISISQSDDD